MANGWYYHEDFKASRRGEVKRGEVRRGVSAPNLDRRTPVYNDDDNVPSNAWAIRSISVANLEHDENAGDFDVSEFRFFTTWQRQPAVRKVYAERAAAKNRREKQAEALRIAAAIAAALGSSRDMTACVAEWTPSRRQLFFVALRPQFASQLQSAKARLANRQIRCI